MKTRTIAIRIEQLANCLAKELPAFSANPVKRVSLRRKGHLFDTGLACYLQRVSSPTALTVNPLLGAMFESWVVGLLHQQMIGLPMPPRLYHWRSAGGAEVDVVLERDGILYPIEVKCRTVLTGHDLRGLRSFREAHGHLRVATGLLVYAGTEAVRMDGNTIALPWDAVCQGQEE
jgi:predicted AAA+ superfamily ATPase